MSYILATKIVIRYIDYDYAYTLMYMKNAAIYRRERQTSEIIIKPVVLFISHASASSALPLYVSQAHQHRTIL